MAQIRKIDIQFEVKSPADKFYDAFRNKTQLMPKICSQTIKDVKVVQGDGKSVGSVRLWSFVAGGKSQTAKEIFDADDKNRTIAYRLVEGEIMNYYKSWKTILNIMPVGEGSLVKWTMEFEKLNESVPDPVTYVDFLTTWAKDVDAYLLNA